VANNSAPKTDQALDLALLLGAEQSTAALGLARALDLHCCPAPAPKRLVACTTVQVWITRTDASSPEPKPAARNFTARRRRSFNATSGNLRESIFSISL
jgi:hypothetical protein